ncbi:hypothetical protein [Microbacterium sp. ZW T5_56]|uniref:hypothetical protein n=1 Tax=Microbacterium sp. ZW T5_56 TaxID=3378081 RepID=UPI0038532784
MSAFRGRPLLGATVLVATLVLGGCSATIAPDPNAVAPAQSAAGEHSAADSGSASDPPTDERSEGPDVETTTTDSESASAGSGTGSVTAAEHRAAVANTVDQQLACGGGNLDITEFAVRVEVTDDCDTIVVTGSSVLVVAQKVKTLVVDAFSTDALVASVDAIRVTSKGSSTTVRWESGTPSIEDAGFASDLRLSEFVP